MFTKLARFRHLGPRHMVPHWLEAAHSNDNPRGRRRPAGQCRSPQPVLACHWIFVDDGRLECHWAVENFEELPAEEPGGRQTRCSHASSFSAKAIGHPRTGFGSRYVAVLHRNFRRDLSRAAMTAKESGAVKQQRRSIAADNDWISKGSPWTKDLVVPL
jgi:hypothetical protein